MPSFLGGLSKDRLRNNKNKAKIAGDVAIVAKHSRLSRLPGAPPNWKKKAVDWVPFLDNGEFEKSNRFANIETVREMDRRRKELLRMSRNCSPVDTVGRVSLLPRTVIPRIMKYPFLWVILGAFSLSAGMSRAGTDFGDVDPSAFDTTTSIITFMIVFYVGYCYTRYNQQFDDVERIMHAITNACMFARVHFKDLNEVHRYWRYLNMLHVAAYTSLTTFYSEDNFFRPVCEKWELFAHDAQDRAAEAAIFEGMSLDGQDMRVCSMLETWIFEIMREEVFLKADKHSPAVYKVMLDEVMKVGDSTKRLFTYQYQVMPFIYTHLVSICSTVYLMFFAFTKGLHFGPDAGYTYGFLLPLCSVLLSTLAIFGLLEVGDTIGDPFGRDPEDFAVLHFVECTVVASLEAISVDSVVPRHKTDFYSNTELRAAIAVATRMVYRFRARKKLRLQREGQAAAADEGSSTGAPSEGTGTHTHTERTPRDTPQLGASSSRQELRQEAQLSSKPLKTRPPSEMQQKRQKPKRRADGAASANAAANAAPAAAGDSSGAARPVVAAAAPPTPPNVARAVDASNMSC